MKRLITATLTLLASIPALAEPTMTTLDINGLVLSGAEYWPFHGDRNISYPDDVLWGFYPERGVPPEEGEDPNPDTASPAAVACATRAWEKLRTFMESDQPVLRRIIEIGADDFITHKFYLWTNDYTRAVTPFPYAVRTNRLWFWARSPQVPGRTPGYWKWESTVLQDGTCLIPEDAQIAQYLQDKLAELER